MHKKNFSGINLQQQDYASKIKRSLNSKEAVLKTVLESDFSKEIKSLCRIKFQVADLAMKESQNQKGSADVLALWWRLIKNIYRFHLYTPLILKSYTILNRSLPSQLINRLKQIKMQRKFQNDSSYDCPSSSSRN